MSEPAVERPRRRLGTTGDMVRSIVVTVLGGVLLFGSYFWVRYRDDHRSTITAVDQSDVQIALDQARRALGPTALLPASTPTGWSITSARFTGVLHLGYVVPGNRYVDLEVGPDDAVGKALDAFDGSHLKPSPDGVDGLALFVADDGTLTLRGTGIGLTGTKQAADLTALAAVLHTAG